MGELFSLWATPPQPISFAATTRTLARTKRSGRLALNRTTCNRARSVLPETPRTEVAGSVRELAVKSDSSSPEETLPSWPSSRNSRSPSWLLQGPREVVSGDLQARG
jgi:hypothetical protein